MKVGIVANLNKVKDEQIIVKLSKTLLKNGYETVCFQDNSAIDGVDVLIVLGGDGAILHSAVVAAQKAAKIIGINYGNLGFLAEYERDQTAAVCELLKKIEDGSCHILKRSILELQIGEKVY